MSHYKIKTTSKFTEFILKLNKVIRIDNDFAVWCYTYMWYRIPTPFLKYSFEKISKN